MYPYSAQANNKQTPFLTILIVTGLMDTGIYRIEQN